MNQRALRTLILWVIWASTALIVYLTLYRDTAVWEFMQKDPSKVTWLIMGLFLLGVVGSFALAMTITFETLRAMRVQEMAKADGLFGVKTRRTNRAVDRFFAALKDTLNTDGQPDVEALLNVELAVYQRISHFVEVIGNLLITLGLIGTVMGLTLTLTGLTSSLDALGHDQEMLLAGLRKAMSGMGTAFYTTLLGAVLGGVLLRVFAQITEHGVQSLYDILMRICLVYCSADYKPSFQRDMRFINKEMTAFDENVKNVQAAFDSSKAAMAEFQKEIARFNDPDGEQSGQSLEAAIDRHRRYCEQLREEIHLMNAVNRSWWARLKMLFGMRS